MTCFLLGDVPPLDVLPHRGDPWTHSLLEHLFVGPMLPASILAVIVFTLVLVSLLGVFSLDWGAGGADIHVDPGGDVGLDLDPGVDPGFDPSVHPDVEAGTGLPSDGHHVSGDFLGGFAAATMKAVHLDRVPLMVWLTVFSLFFWVLSFVLWFEFDVRHYPPTLFVSGILAFRNGVMAIVLTRLLTSPLHRLLTPPTHHHASTLIGGTAVVETSVVDESFGRARYATNAAPLLIDIRTLDGPIAKGMRVRIIHHDAAARVYYVQAEEGVQAETPSEVEA